MNFISKRLYRIGCARVSKNIDVAAFNCCASDKGKCFTPGVSVVVAEDDKVIKVYCCICPIINF